LEQCEADPEAGEEQDRENGGRAHVRIVVKLNPEAKPLTGLMDENTEFRVKLTSTQGSRRFGCGDVAGCC
jgi:hypothetical protein